VSGSERSEREVDLKGGGYFSKSGRRSEEEERSWGDHEVWDRPAQRLGRKGSIAKRETHCKDHIGSTASNQYYFP